MPSLNLNPNAPDTCVYIFRGSVSGVCRSIRREVDADCNWRYLYGTRFVVSSSEGEWSVTQPCDKLAPSSKDFAPGYGDTSGPQLGRGALNRPTSYERLTRLEGPEGVSDEGSRQKEAAPT